jgi:microcystin-dependent protein
MTRFLPQNSLFRGKYPPQFWILIAGNLVSTIGTSMIWPF